MPAARRFAGNVLDGCPAREVLLLCVSELCANAITHSASGQGGVFIVEVGYPRDGMARVAVTDEGGVSVPAAGTPDPMAESGRGLALVAACTTRWGYADAYPGRTVWAEASWPIPVPSPAALTAPDVPGGHTAPGTRAASAAASRRSRSPRPSAPRSARRRVFGGRPSRGWPPDDLPSGPAA